MCDIVGDEHHTLGPHTMQWPMGEVNTEKHKSKDLTLNFIYITLMNKHSKVEKFDNKTKQLKQLQIIAHELQA